MKKTVLLVGGGTGGHIFPLHPLIRELNKTDTNVHVLTSDTPLDTEIIDRNFSDCVMTHHIIHTGKIRAYVSLKNFTDFFRILRGIGQARKLIKKIKPDIIFFKGGFVGFPILASLILRKKLSLRPKLPKIYLHESDISAGKLTKLFEKYAEKTFKSYGQNATPLFWHDPKITSEELPGGSPLPRIIIFGGSQGAQWLNQKIAHCHEQLTEKYHVTLVTGKGKQEALPPSIHQHEFMDQPALYEEIARSDLVITRAGSSIFQVLHLQKNALLIPLPGSAREHQLHNAEYFCKEKGLCHYLPQRECSDEKFLEEITKTLSDTVMTAALKRQNIRSEERKIVERMIG